MPSVQQLIDSICANFTEESMFTLVKTLLAQGPCTIGDIERRVLESDRSLDTKSAHTLATAAVEALAQRGDLAVRGSHLYPAGSLPA